MSIHDSRQTIGNNESVKWSLSAAKNGSAIGSRTEKPREPMAKSVQSRTVTRQKPSRQTGGGHCHQNPNTDLCLDRPKRRNRPVHCGKRTVGRGKQEQRNRTDNRHEGKLIAEVSGYQSLSRKIEGLPIFDQNHPQKVANVPLNNSANRIFIVPDSAGFDKSITFGRRGCGRVVR